MTQKLGWMIFGLVMLTAGEPRGVQAQTVANLSHGRELAQQLCSSCHLVHADQPGPVPDGVPSFMAIAGQGDATEDRLIAKLLAPPHPAMPEPPVDRRQMQDLLAYILSLRKR
jgi:mono/diheme cytochrome c family protein